jgi:hypothetical protein
MTRMIRICFTRPKNLLLKPYACLIMLFQGTPFDHAAVKISAPSFDRDLIYQASHSMVNFMSPDVFNDENIVLAEYTVSISDEHYKPFMQFLIDNAGKPYGLKGVIGLGWVRINELVGRKINNPFRSDGKSYFCSELVFRALSLCTNVDLKVDASDVSPKDLYNMMPKLLASST